MTSPSSPGAQIRQHFDDVIFQGKARDLLFLNPLQLSKAIVEIPLLDPPSSSLLIEEELVQITTEDPLTSSQALVKIAFTRPAAKSGQKLPAVIVLHGTGASRTSPQLHPITHPLLARGYEVITFDSRYHGDRASGETKEEKRRCYDDALVRSWRHGSGDGGRQEFPFLLDTVWDVVRVLDHVGEHRAHLTDSTRVGITGISLGGMHAWLAAALEGQRIHLAIPFIGVQGFRWAVEFDRWQERVSTIQKVFAVAQADLGEPALTAAVVAKVWNKITPGLLGLLDAPSSLRCIAPRPLCILNGELDGRCPREGLEEALRLVEEDFKRLGVAERFRCHFAVGKGHEITEEQFRMATEWVEKFL